MSVMVRRERGFLLVVTVLTLVVLVSCGRTGDVVAAGEANEMNAYASYIRYEATVSRSEADDLGQNILMIAEEGRRGLAFRDGFHTRIPNPDRQTGGRGEQIEWEPGATAAQRLAIEDRALDLGATEFFYLSPLDEWPWCAESSLDCPLVAETFMPADQLQELLARHAPDRLESAG